MAQPPQGCCGQAVGRAASFAGAMAGYVAGGLRLVSDDVAVARRAACEPCARRTEDWKCLECGCHLLRGPLGTPGKTTLPREACPLGRWPAVR